MELGLGGRIAVVTAASKGLGRAAAEALASEGAKIVLNARSVAALEDLAATNGRAGDPVDFGKVVAFLCSEPARFISGVALGVDGAAVTGLL